MTRIVKTVAHTAGSVVPLIILIGQSNATGLERIANMPLQYRGEQKYCLMWNPLIASLSPQFLTLENELDRATCQPSYAKETIAGSAGNYGIEFPLSKLVKSKLNKQVRMVKWSLGGTPLALSGGQDWSTSSVGELFDKAVDAVNDAKAAIGAEGKTVNTLFAAWVQGENDCYTLSDANNYFTNLVTFFDEFKRQINEPDLVFVQNTVKTGTPELVAEYVTIVNEAKQRFTDLDPYKRFLVSSEDLESFPDDPIHFNHNGIELLGIKLFNAVKHLL